MKKMMLLVGLLMLTVGCKGPQGDRGEAGSKGATGDVGPAGPGKVIMLEGAVTSDFMVVPDPRITTRALVNVYLTDGTGAWTPVPIFVPGLISWNIIVFIYDGKVEIYRGSLVAATKYRVVVSLPSSAPGIGSLAPRLF